MLNLEAVHKSYEVAGFNFPVIRGVDLRIDDGERILVTGEPGSGKGALLNLMGGLEKPEKGEVNLGGTVTRRLDAGALSSLRSRKVGFIFQSFGLKPRLSSLENLIREPNADGNELPADSALEQVGLDPADRREVRELCLDDRQRLSIACTLRRNPYLMLCDLRRLPDTALVTLEVLERLNRELGMTVVVASDDVRTGSFARRIIRLDDGRVIDDLPRDLFRITRQQAAARTCAAPGSGSRLRVGRPSQ